MEVCASRDAALAGAIESRFPVERPLDLLAQHAVTIALGGGFRADELLAEVRTTYAYRQVSDIEWAWVLDFITRGGEALRAYPEFQRVEVDDGVYRVTNRQIARRHLLSIGTIVADASIEVRYLSGGRLGSVEESFISRLRPITFSMAMNDYGVELLAPDPAPLEEALAAGLLSPANLVDDIPASLNAAEMARRQFREIARIAGLTFTGYPGQNKTVRQMQASAGLLFDVFVKYDSGNLLIEQAHREVLERNLERSRLGQTLERLSHGEVRIMDIQRPSPLSFPILVDRTRHRLSSEKLADRIRRMTA